MTLREPNHFSLNVEEFITFMLILFNLVFKRLMNGCYSPTPVLGCVIEINRKFREDSIITVKLHKITIGFLRRFWWDYLYIQVPKGQVTRPTSIQHTVTTQPRGPSHSSWIRHTTSQSTMEWNVTQHTLFSYICPWLCGPVTAKLRLYLLSLMLLVGVNSASRQRPEAMDSAADITSLWDSTALSANWETWKSWSICGHKTAQNKLILNDLLIPNFGVQETGWILVAPAMHSIH